MENKTKLLAIIAAIILIGIGVYFSLKKERKEEKIEKKTEQAAETQKTLQEKIAKPAEINPIQNLPQSNPFETKTNPFKDGYKNPFGR